MEESDGRGREPVRWLLLDGDRFEVSGVVLAATFAALVAALLLVSPSLGSNRLLWLFNGLVNGLLSLLTIILTINQLILSKQFGSPEDLHERLEQQIEFRRTVEDEIGAAMTPPSPRNFLRVLFGSLRGRAVELGSIDCDDEHARGALREYAETVARESEVIVDDLEREQFEMTGVLTVLDYDDSWQYYANRRIRTMYGSRLPERALDVLDDVRTLLNEIDTARQYFKTLYLQRELAQLSRRIVYVGLPSILVAALTILAYRNGWVLSLGEGAAIALTSALITATLAPIALLFAYAVRLATVVRETVSFGPFVLRAERRRDRDWNT